MHFYLTRKASEDLKSIARYTKKHWGSTQRNRYLEQLDEAFHAIAKAPDKGRSAKSIRSGYWKFGIGKHVIFYRKIKAEVEITRILHERMDMKARLEE